MFPKHLPEIQTTEEIRHEQGFKNKKGDAKRATESGHHHLLIRGLAHTQQSVLGKPTDPPGIGQKADTQGRKQAFVKLLHCGH